MPKLKSVVIDLLPCAPLLPFAQKWRGSSVPDIKRKSRILMIQLFPCVALEGFEPSQAEPESDVLPLHHKAIIIGLRVQSYKVCRDSPNVLATFFQVFLRLFLNPH